MQNVNMITSRPIGTKIGTNISFEGDDEGILVILLLLSGVTVLAFVVLVLVRVVVGLGLAIVAFIIVGVPVC